MTNVRLNQQEVLHVHSLRDPISIRPDQHSPNQIHHKDTRGRYSATVAKVMDIDNQNVLQRQVPARVRRVQHPFTSGWAKDISVHLWAKDIS